MTPRWSQQPEACGGKLRFGEAGMPKYCSILVVSSVGTDAAAVCWRERLQWLTWQPGVQRTQWPTCGHKKTLGEDVSCAPGLEAGAGPRHALRVQEVARQWRDARAQGPVPQPLLRERVKVLADQRLQLCQVLLCECALQSEMLLLLNAKADGHRCGGQALRSKKLGCKTIQHPDIAELQLNAGPSCLPQARLMIHSFSSFAFELCLCQSAHPGSSEAGGCRTLGTAGLPRGVEHGHVQLTGGLPGEFTIVAKVKHGKAHRGGVDVLGVCPHYMQAPLHQPNQVATVCGHNLVQGVIYGAMGRTVHRTGVNYSCAQT